jgi:Uncharacterised nucleotidyltransferase
VAPWPADWVATEPGQAESLHQTMFDRIAFHGIALLIAQQSAALATWPAPLRDLVLAEARGQSFWEMGHCDALARLIEALSAADIPSIVTKGSALAYTLYPEPALRRRGDSDIFLLGADRQAVRKALSAVGMEQMGDARPLQESWAITCAMGFAHVFDLHWRGSASAVVSRCYDRGGIGQRAIPLPRVSPSAQAIAPTDNAIMIAINRALHGQFGYVSGGGKMFENDRLIWAMDLDLLCNAFDESDWQALADTAEASGTAPAVASALGFAQSVLGTAIPPDIRARLTAHPGDPDLLRYLSALSGIDRLRMDLSACRTLKEKLQLVRYILLPGAELLHERFPDATHESIPALRARRLVEGVGKLLMGRG